MMMTRSNNSAIRTLWRRMGGLTVVSMVGCFFVVLLIGSSPSQAFVGDLPRTTSAPSRRISNTRRRIQVSAPSSRRAPSSALFFFFGKNNNDETSTTIDANQRKEQVQQLEQDIDAQILKLKTTSNNNSKEDDEARLLDLIAQLEALNQWQQPNRSPEFLGEWHVWWTNCPPPSNGQLGPFTGTSGQVIFPDTSDGSSDASPRSYQNLLKVPPNDWLTATLDGVWEEWDGEFLVDTKQNDKNWPKSSATDDSNSQLTDEERQAMDWGATHWKVTFLQLTIKLLGFSVVQQTFPPGTSRVWRTTYLDTNSNDSGNGNGNGNGDDNNSLRIVRAGRTGRVEDEVVFYTKRSPAPVL